MLTARFGTVVLTLAALLAGCADKNPYGQYNLGPAKPTVQAAMQAIGGYNAWQKVQRLSAVAIVTAYGPNDLAKVDRLKLTIDLRGGLITARGQSTDGPWTATVDNDQHCTVKGPTGELTKDQIGFELSMILHRLRGPMNLMGYGEHARSAEPLRLGGVDLVRVGVDGDNRMAVAYYFDRESGLLRFVTAGADAPGRKGTVTVYDGPESYVHLSGGARLPRHFRVVQIGQDVLVSDQKVLDVEFTTLKVK